jgi:CubicO group peptidase (beta-lactamase class C family)
VNASNRTPCRIVLVHTPGEIGLHAQRYQQALDLLEGWCRTQTLPAAAVMVGRRDRALPPACFGRQRLAPGGPPLRDDAIFLVASITKPVVAMGALLLVERGLLALGDRVEQYLPAFGRAGAHQVTIRNLLTHTSGLPDMLPDNVALRAANAPLEAFVEGACRVPLDFPPGRAVQYQSMGFALLGAIIHKVSGQPCAEFLRRNLFEPLGMRDTALGAPEEWFQPSGCKVDRIAEMSLPAEQAQAPGWNWNSPYWRRLGAPWGGLLTTPADLARFAQMMLGMGRLCDVQVLSSASVRAATRNQLDAMPDVPEADRRTRPWGLGWRLNWPAHSANFGDLLSPASYGHWGATGTLLWIDPSLDAFVILLTTQPQEPHGSYLARASNALAAAF